MKFIGIPTFLQPYREKVISGGLGLFLLIALPYIHLGLFYQLWNTEKSPVEKHTCTCSCWDTYFKGQYERGIPKYKHVYFNLTSNTFKIWAFTMLVMVVFYEAISRLAKLFMKGELRYSMFVLFLTVVYPHYYAWWGNFNYWNDEYYDQWNHQAFFTVTELLSTCIVLYLCDKSKPCLPSMLLVVVDVALLHILVSGWDQFIKNVILQKGEGFRVIRDLGLMIPDILHIIVPLAEIWKYAKFNGISLIHLYSSKQIGFSCLGIFSLLFICHHL